MTGEAQRCVRAATLALLAGLASGAALAHHTGPEAAPRLWVQRTPLGSGTPAAGPSVGHERTARVADDSQHVPNTLPGHPTAATIWPREVEVGCDVDAQGRWWCDGYDVHPALGRGEYIYVRPVRRAPAPEPEYLAPAPVVNVTCPCCAPPAPPKTRKKPLG